MNFNKILMISIMLMLLSISLGAVSAYSEPIKLGEITSSDFHVTDVSSKGSLPGSMSSSSTELYNVNFTADIKIDISKMSDANKKLLIRAADDENTSLILNLTSDNAVSVELYQGSDFSIDGNTLKIHSSTFYTSTDESKDVTINSVGLRSSDNQLFVADKN